MPRFVILEHDWPTLHWDFLLEAGAALRSWRLRSEPASGTVMLAEAMPDHRSIYLDYEGPVSGGRGTVKRWDGGTFEWIDDRVDRVEIQLHGHIFGGRAVLLRVGENWTCHFSR